MADSLKLVAARLSHKKRSSSWLWVEPHVEKGWLSRIFAAITATLRQTTDITEAGKLEEQSRFPSRSFLWHDPHNGHTAKSHVIVTQFRNL